MLVTNGQFVDEAVTVIEGMGARIIGPEDVLKKLKLSRRWG